MVAWSHLTIFYSLGLLELQEQFLKQDYLLIYTGERKVFRLREILSRVDILSGTAYRGVSCAF